MSFVPESALRYSVKWKGYKCSVALSTLCPKLADVSYERKLERARQRAAAKAQQPSSAKPVQRTPR
jgi:hypothetical protein